MCVRSPDDEPFRHYTRKHRIVAWVSQTLFDNLTYTVRHGLIRGMKRRGGLAWLPEFFTSSAITAEQKYWVNQNLRDMVVYDVGAFQGLMTLFFARQACKVISYEPNSRNRERLDQNLRLNAITNVLVRPVGIGSKREVATMVALPLMPGGASIERATVTGLRNSNRPVLSEEIPVTTLDGDIREMSLPPPDFVKIDIEGGELDALIGAKETLAAHRPQLFLEMHGETMNLKRKNVAAIVCFLNEAGYSEISHVESNTRITLDNSSIAAEGHLFCTCLKP